MNLLVQKDKVVIGSLDDPGLGQWRHLNAKETFAAIGRRAIVSVTNQRLNLVLFTKNLNLEKMQVIVLINYNAVGS